MPLVDRRTDSVVLRIVYDGPPEAGKTTNLRHLCERLSLGRRGQLQSPGGGDRTQFFDWLDVTGGYVAGRRLRCQLVTVPGQIELAKRRRYLLDSADVVVFVADTRPEQITAARDSLALLQRVMAARDELPLLVQANKQDLAGAVELDRVGEMLDVGRDVPIVGAQAFHGVGVLETFMLAVRLAVDRIRVAIARGLVADGEGGTHEALLDELRAVESMAVATAPAIVPPPPPRWILPRSDVATGLVWPPQSGRFVLRALDDERARGETITPVSETSVRCGSWSLHASGPWRSADEARVRLLDAVSRQPSIGALVPASRTLAVAGAGDVYWVWYLVEHTRTLLDATQVPDENLGARISAAHDLVERLAAGAARAGITVHCDARFISDDGLQYLGPAWPGEPIAVALAHEQLGAAAPPAPTWELPAVGIPAGMVWPQVRGRIALSSLTPPGRAATGAPHPWAPRDALEVTCHDWIAHTCDAWYFADLDDGRRALLDAARWQTRLGSLTPPGRTLALCPIADGSRLWMLTPDQPRSLWDSIIELRARGGATDLAGARARAIGALEAVQQALARAGIACDVALDVVAVDSEPRLLLPTPVIAQGGAAARLGRQLAELESLAC